MKKGSLKLAFVASALSLVLCFAMLVGSTFAWFTDSKTSKNNVIKTGTLDIELYYQKSGENYWIKVNEDTNMFSENVFWEPGHTEVVKLKIVNAGSLALKYRLGVNVAEENGSTNVSGVNFKLSDFIQYGVADGANDYTRSGAIAAVSESSTSLTSPYTSDMITLLPNTEENSDNVDYVTVIVYMPESIGNEANFAPNASVPRISLGINLLAVQDSLESDSFDNSYDEGLDPSVDYNE